MIDSYTYLTYDDVNILPRFSDISSRSTVNLTTKFSRNYSIDIPIVGAPMDTVCGLEMLVELYILGGIGCLHRFSSNQQQCDDVSRFLRAYPSAPVCAAIGVTGDYLDRAKALLDTGAKILMFDVAHGHHRYALTALDQLNQLKSRYEFDVVVGSIATPQAAEEFENNGADGLRVGIGNGSLCETRVRTGIGVPQISAIMNIAEVVKTIPIIADGGIRYPGDVAKALAAGANSVMLGSALAGTDKTPGPVISVDTGILNKRNYVKLYRGLASRSAKVDNGQADRYIEGASKLINAKGAVEDVVFMFIEGLQSAFSYVGANNMEEFKVKAELIRVSSASAIEAQPHLFLTDR